MPRALWKARATRAGCLRSDTLPRSRLYQASARQGRSQKRCFPSLKLIIRKRERGEVVASSIFMSSGKCKTGKVSSSLRQAAKPWGRKPHQNSIRLSRRVSENLHLTSLASFQLSSTKNRKRSLACVDIDDKPCKYVFHQEVVC